LLESERTSYLSFLSGDAMDEIIEVCKRIATAFERIADALTVPREGRTHG